MGMTDPISDMLTRIRNAQMVRKDSVAIPASKIKVRICEILVEEGYVADFKLVDAEIAAKKRIEVTLKYFKNRPVIERIVRVSKPGRRRYVGKDAIPWVHQGLGISILSTSKGVLSHRQARKQGLGGELLMTVF
ncbi:MAG: 30S ribosomal protein S8 [Magnetococcales bacterium]|nr:30S ribosomal protein S8 [Magnetococcales bacterium]